MTDVGRKWDDSWTRLDLRGPGSLRIRIVESAGGGLLFALAFPPFGFTLAALLAPALLARNLRGSRALQRVVCGLTFGATYFALLLRWLIPIGWHAWVGLVLVESAFLGLFGLVIGSILQVSSVASCIGFSAVWVLLVEAARARFPVGGFSWGAVGTALVGTRFASLAPLGGELLVSWVGVFVASLLALSLIKPMRAIRGLLGVAVAVIALSGVGAFGVDDGTIRVAVIQGDVPLPAEPASPARTEHVLQDHMRKTEELAPGQVDLVIWPEGILDVHLPPVPGESAPAPLATLAGRLHAWFLAGVVSDAGPGHFRNSAILVAPDGIVVGRYDKTHPVPFGEYVPFRSLFGTLPGVIDVPNDMVPGDGPQVLSYGPFDIGTPISFEVTFSRIVQAFAAEGATVLIVPTNTSSYGPSAATAAQELQATRMRSLELGLWSVQAAPSGISAVIDADGTIVAQTELYEARILVANVAIRRSATPFSRWGETPTLVLAILAGFLGLAASRPPRALEGSQTRTTTRRSRIPYPIRRRIELVWHIPCRHGRAAAAELEALRPDGDRRAGEPMSGCRES